MGVLVYSTGFAANPAAYLPQYGGYCAFGVAVGKKLDANPRFADIVDGKLYLFLDAGAFAAYEDDKAGTLAKAESNWARDAPRPGSAVRAPFRPPTCRFGTIRPVGTHCRRLPQHVLTGHESPHTP